MTNRREFLHMGVAALSLPLAARAGASSGIFGGSEEQRAEPLYKILFDQRYSTCARFAEEIERRALATHAIRADITKLWYDDLYHRWKKGTVAIAGMTAPGAIFCLEMLARDAGMRVALRVDHRSTRGRMGQRIDHEFEGPVESVTLAGELETSADRWTEKMAEMVARFPAERGRMRTARYSARVNSIGGEWDHLVTWVIAPVAARARQA
jgi:hypothetical protein